MSCVNGERINCNPDGLHGLLEVSLDIAQYRDINNTTIFDCSLRNIGDADITLGNSFLFIDQGILDEESGTYMFPFLQKKFLDIPGIANEDCAMCDNCRKGCAIYPSNISHISRFFSEYVDENIYTNCFVLPHLSSASVLYMAPKETFNEAIVVHLPQGVYRAILVSVPKSSNCDCMCKNKCFAIM